MKERVRLEETGIKFIDWKERYRRQRLHAKRRGIPFNLTYEQWIMWWGLDLLKRGRGDGKLQMCRYNDEGPYELGNIFKGTCNENSSEKFSNGKAGRRPATLTSEEVAQIKLLLQQGLPQSLIAEEFGTSQRTVTRINQDQYRSKN